MHKIAFIIPYYGKFPSFFQFFLNSCKPNHEIDWYIFSDIDITEFELPDNVKYINMNFNELRILVQSKFDFKISLNTPYKLCDYKPAYGYIFEEYLKGYDFWGYCDIDLLFGDLSKFITEDILITYDRIGHLGHCALYRNTKLTNTLFMQEINGIMRYRQVFSTDSICIFDEWGINSINSIAFANDIKLLLWSDFFDVYPYDNNFKNATSIINTNNMTCTTKQDAMPSVITYENGKLFSHALLRPMKEHAYVHLQKRNMLINCSTEHNHILLYPDIIVPYNNHITGKAIYKILFGLIFNHKCIRNNFNKLKYFVAEKTGNLRHKFKKHKV